MPPKSIFPGLLNAFIMNAIRKIRTPKTHGLMLSIKAAEIIIPKVNSCPNILFYWATRKGRQIFDLLETFDPFNLRSSRLH